LEGVGGVNTVKTLTFEKVGGGVHNPPNCYDGAAPGGEVIHLRATY